MPSAPCGEQIRLLRYELSLFHRKPVSCRPQGPSENAVSISKIRCICCEFCSTARRVSHIKRTRTSGTCANFITAFPGCPREGGELKASFLRGGSKPDESSGAIMKMSDKVRLLGFLLILNLCLASPFCQRGGAAVQSARHACEHKAKGSSMTVMKTSDKDSPSGVLLLYKTYR